MTINNVCVYQETIMGGQKQHTSDSDLTEILTTFLASPPAGTNESVIEAFTNAISTGNSILPPRLFYEAVEQSAIAISITDPNAKILYVNPSFERVTGYSPEDIVGRNESVLSDKITPAIVYETMWGRLIQKKPWSGVLINRRKNDERYLADLTIAPVVNDKGDTTHYLGIHRDVTEVHRLEKEVLNQKALIESMVDAAPVIVALLDDSGRVILDNMAYKKLAGDMRGREPATEFLTALEENMGREFETIRKQMQNFSGQEICFDPGGEKQTRWYSCSGTWIRESDSSADAFFEGRKEIYLLLVCNEITTQKRQQEEVKINALRALMAEEELAQSMREMLNGAMYQLQGPCNLISAASGMLDRRAADENGDNAALKSVLQQAMEAGQTALETLKGCMPEAVLREPEPVNINQIVREALALCTERMLSEAIVIDWKPAPVLPFMLGYENSLRSMFKQLVDNAIDAMSSISGPRELSITTGATDTVIEVTIADTGRGIPPDQRLKVFEPFFSTKKGKGAGAGMGLAMVQDVINEHAGNIEIDSEYRNGCCFNIQIPIQRTKLET
jgi:nitrogen fixation negative regulator NifL